MQINQAKFVGIVTENVLFIANERIDFDAHNYCIYCNNTYSKDTEYCAHCTVRGKLYRLKVERTPYVQCYQCGFLMYKGDLFVSRKRKVARHRYTCIRCALPLGLITLDDLKAFLKHKPSAIEELEKQLTINELNEVYENDSLEIKQYALHKVIA